jgi:hypothetical protein
MAKNKFQIDRERDRVEELARLIAQADPYGESTPADNRFREETASEGYDERPGLPPVPQLPADLNARKQECEFGEHRDDDRAYAVDNQPCAAQKEYAREAPRARRTRGSVMAVVGLAMLGAAGAFVLGIWHLNGMDWPEPKAPRCGRKSRRLASRVERRTSRTCYRIGRKARKALTIRYPRGIDILNIHAMEDAVWRHDRRVMRSGKTEDAMSEAGMIGIAGR